MHFYTKMLKQPALRCTRQAGFKSNSIAGGPINNDRKSHKGTEVSQVSHNKKKSLVSPGLHHVQRLCVDNIISNPLV